MQPSANQPVWSGRPRPLPLTPNRVLQAKFCHPERSIAIGSSNRSAESRDR